MLKSINKKKTNKTIKQELLNLMQESDNIEEQQLNKTAKLSASLKKQQL